MKVRAKLYEGEAVQFTGAPMAFDDKNGLGIKIFHTMRGNFLRRGREANAMTQIEIGSWIMTEPEFRVMTDKVFKAQFEIIPKGANDE